MCFPNCKTRSLFLPMDEFNTHALRCLLRRNCQTFKAIPWGAMRNKNGTGLHKWFLIPIATAQYRSGPSCHYRDYGEAPKRIILQFCSPNLIFPCDHDLMDRPSIWSEIDTERTALAHQLAFINAPQWQAQSLCTELTVREVLAHLTASGTLSGTAWFLGVLRARFDFDQQVADRLREQLGSTPDDTLKRFCATIGSRTSPPIPKLALLGEMIVHGNDIRQPLGLHHTHRQETLDALLRYYAGSDQIVVAKKRIKGLQLESLESGITIGHGLPVRGRTLALIMAMTGRKAYCSELSGSGPSLLASRCD